MEWNDKVKMIQFFNINDMENFKKTVLVNLDIFDAQAYDMFIIAVEIIPENLDQHKEFYLQVLEAYNKVKDKIEISFKADLRFALVEAYYDEGIQ